MQIDVIDTCAGLDRLADDWQSIYRDDPEAHFFLSWTWMRKWLEGQAEQWLVLAARRPAPDGRCVALFPLRFRTRIGKDGDGFNELAMGGNRVADYTGLLCRPADEADAVPAFAAAIAKMKWTHFQLESVRMSAHRLEMLLRPFRSDRFSVATVSGLDREGIDLHICPTCELPAHWDAFLEGLSANTRQKLRRLLRKLDTSTELRITHATPETVERDIDILLNLWDARWRERKGDDASRIQRNVRAMLSHCCDTGNLLLPVLWSGDKPVGALGSIVDHDKRAVLFWLAGRDPGFEAPSPGLVLHAHSIRHAIGEGLRSYDFLRGNETYKYSFASKEVEIRHVVVSTWNRRNPGGRLEARTLPVAVSLAAERLQAGALVEAEHVLRQILETDGDFAPALAVMAQLKRGKRDHEAAIRYFRAALAADPALPKARLGLAGSLAAVGDHAGAVAALQAVIARDARNATAHSALGRSLLALGRHEEAIDALAQARQLQPQDLRAELDWAVAMHRVGLLTAAQARTYARQLTAEADRLAALGATKSAIEQFRQAIALCADLVEAHFGLGRLFEAQRDRADALACYRRVVELDPDHQDAGDRLAACLPPHRLSPAAVGAAAPCNAHP